MANYTRELDPSRPVTAAIAVPSQDDKAVSDSEFKNSVTISLN